MIGRAQPILAMLTVACVVGPGCQKSAPIAQSTPTVPSSSTAPAPRPLAPKEPLDQKSSPTEVDTPISDVAAPNTTPPGPTTQSSPNVAATKLLSKAEQFEQLRKETMHRTGKKPTVDDVLETFQKADMELRRVRRTIASTSGARFCRYGSTALNGRVLVCEYATAKDATAGAETVAAQLVNERRVVKSHGHLSLVVFIADPAPARVAEQKRLFELFQAMTPEPGDAPAPPTNTNQ
ncbi:MAG: hypothetical protein ACI9OJ_003872 [Myxococcota bacterium]|jgi:hypothetical protein